MTVTSLAQVDTGAIVGKVMDLSGAAIPNAKVTAHEQATGIDITVVTGIDGNICTTIISTPKTSLFRMGNASRSSA